MPSAAALPEEYLARMRDTLGDQFDSFIASYSEGPYRALRFNAKKARDDTREYLISKWDLRPISWCSDGYYYPDYVRPGLSPYHAAGVYYIQEPSAMLPAELARTAPGDIVLDLCAAPGGKTTRLLEKAQVVLANDPVPKRARTLSSNIERMGFTNSLVTSAYPDALAEVLQEVFDIILVDAPCSGEGLFRKDTAAIGEWSEANVSRCAERQRAILESAYRMLRPGGRLIYSTCTFEKDENEGQLLSFIAVHDDLELLETRMLYPHIVEGEGQFAGVVYKEKRIHYHKDIHTPDELLKYMKKHGGERVHVLRAGLMKDGDRPTHAETMARDYATDSGNKINLADEAQALPYLRGETLKPADSMLPAPGWLTVYYDGYPLGLAKYSGGMIKNHYPKGLRFH